MPSLVREDLHLRAPHQADFGPAVKEDHQWAVGGSGLPVVGRVAWGAERGVGKCGCQRELLLGRVYRAQELHKLFADFGRGLVLYPVAYVVEFEVPDEARKAGAKLLGGGIERA
jgi:hypothetical protein